MEKPTNLAMILRKIFKMLPAHTEESSGPARKSNLISSTGHPMFLSGDLFFFSL